MLLPWLSQYCHYINVTLVAYCHRCDISVDSSVTLMITQPLFHGCGIPPVYTVFLSNGFFSSLSTNQLVYSFPDLPCHRNSRRQTTRLITCPPPPRQTHLIRHSRPTRPSILMTSRHGKSHLLWTASLDLSDCLQPVIVVLALC